MPFNHSDNTAILKKLILGIPVPASGKITETLMPAAPELPLFFVSEKDDGLSIHGHFIMSFLHSYQTTLFSH
jgi:hypothetical protein